MKRNVSDGAEINRELDRLKERLSDIFDKAKALDIPVSVSYLKERLGNKKPVVDSPKTFMQAFEEYIKVSETTKGKSTITNIQGTKNILKDFSKETGYSLEFGTINLDFYNRFLEYCFFVRDIKNNSVGTRIKNLKGFLAFATEAGYNTNMAFKKKGFKKLVEEPEIIFLTWDELIEFYNFKFESRACEEVRDIFCFGCFTGLRYSDIKSLAPEHIFKDFISYRVVKTGEVNNIPLNPYSKAILEKYKGNPMVCLPVKDIKHTNEKLKKAAELAALNRIMQQNHYQGANRITTSGPLHQLITFYVSKKTFMTNFLAKGGSLSTAMAITGNKDIKTARRYFKIVNNLKAEEMKKVFG